MPGPVNDQAARPSGEHNTSLTLLQRLRSNEADAWQRLVQLYGPLVRFWCVRWGVGQEAEDVVQEVFKAVVTGLETFRRDRPGDTFRGWLRGVTRNKLLHFARADRQPRAAGGSDAYLRLQGLADAEQPPEEDPPVELHGLYRRALELVRGEFEEPTWRAFWLNVVEGRTPADIAADLGVTSAAVRKAKSRVLRRLKEEIGDLIE
jgi:RNA polymerase sigma-70 factor (ECF subfamily)